MRVDSKRQSILKSSVHTRAAAKKFKQKHRVSFKDPNPHRLRELRIDVNWLTESQVIAMSGSSGPQTRSASAMDTSTEPASSSPSRAHSSPRLGLSNQPDRDSRSRSRPRIGEVPKRPSSSPAKNEEPAKELAKPETPKEPETEPLKEPEKESSKEPEKVTTASVAESTNALPMTSTPLKDGGSSGPSTPLQDEPMPDALTAVITNNSSQFSLRGDLSCRLNRPSELLISTPRFYADPCVSIAAVGHAEGFLSVKRKPEDDPNTVPTKRANLVFNAPMVVWNPFAERLLNVGSETLGTIENPQMYEGREDNSTSLLRHYSPGKLSYWLFKLICMKVF